MFRSLDFVFFSWLNVEINLSLLITVFFWLKHCELKRNESFVFRIKLFLSQDNTVRFFIRCSHAFISIIFLVCSNTKINQETLCFPAPPTSFSVSRVGFPFERGKKCAIWGPLGTPGQLRCCCLRLWKEEKKTKLENNFQLGKGKNDSSPTLVLACT